MQQVKNKEKSETQGIEFKDNSYSYRYKQFNILLEQHKVREIITSQGYTLICIAPRKVFKSIVTVTIFIPNNLFGSDDKYNEFINSISK